MIHLLNENTGAHPPKNWLLDKYLGKIAKNCKSWSGEKYLGKITKILVNGKNFGKRPKLLKRA